MYFFLITLHILVALTLILTVLLQAGKGGSLGAIFGGGSQAIFGPRGAGNFLTKLTTITAIIFMVTSLLLTVISNRPQTSSIMSQTKGEGHHTGRHTTSGAKPPAPSNTPQEAPKTKAPTPPSSKP